MNRMQSASALIAALCAGLLSTPTMAQSIRATADEPGFYLGAGFGASRHDLTKADFGPVGGAQPTFDRIDRTGKLFGGYRFNPHLAVEAQYMDFGSATATYVHPTGIAKEQYTVHAMSLAAVASMPIGDDLRLFGKLGPAATTAQTSVDSAALGAAGTARRTVLLAGLGATYRVTDSVHLRAEYERLGNVGASGTPGRATTSAFTVGLEYRF